MSTPKWAKKTLVCLFYFLKQSMNSVTSKALAGTLNWPIQGSSLAVSSPYLRLLGLSNYWDAPRLKSSWQMTARWPLYCTSVFTVGGSDFCTSHTAIIRHFQLHNIALYSAETPRDTWYPTRQTEVLVFSLSSITGFTFPDGGQLIIETLRLSPPRGWWQ